MNRYPKYIYSPYTNITRQNMAEYDKRKETFYKKVLELAPDYYHMSVRERLNVRDKAEKAVGFRP